MFLKQVYPFIGTVANQIVVLFENPGVFSGAGCRKMRRRILGTAVHEVCKVVENIIKIICDGGRRFFIAEFVVLAVESVIQRIAALNHCFINVFQSRKAASGGVNLSAFDGRENQVSVNAVAAVKNIRIIAAQIQAGGWA